MQQLTLSHPLSPTRILALPERPLRPRIGLKPAAGPKPAASPRQRLALPLRLRPVQSLSPRPAVAQPVVRGRELPCGATAFVSAAQAWFWTLASLSARHGRARHNDRGPGTHARRNPDAIAPGQVEGNLPHDTLAPLRLTRDPVEVNHVRIPRPCDPDDVIRTIDQMHQRGEITLAHARVLRRWGDAGRAPDADHPKQVKDAMLWTEALTRLEVLLREKSIVATII